jgi:hypothetical protein
VVSLVFAQNWLVDSKLTFLQVTWRIWRRHRCFIPD